MRTPLRLAVVLTVVLVAASACALSGEGPERSPVRHRVTDDAGLASATAGATASPTAVTGSSAALPDDIRTRPDRRRGDRRHGRTGERGARAGGRRGVEPGDVD